ncbi:MAG: T9SS type A sorting domain-containing protein [Gemmatimonadota bacterium]|jgi:hypothetical protein|nr:T9SS type A sorting domain-containing protein [Gemmatimonadota bacterium]MDP7031673.1 T9SS type A sorting domain-containing protein [Gemmatimonadota bacterium]
MRSRVFDVRTVLPVLFAASVLLFAIAVSSEAAPSGSPAEMTAWLSGKAAFYEAHPDLKDTRGSGWKPYNRFKWFYEQRMINGQEVPLGARLRAWEYTMDLLESGAVSTRASWFCRGPENLSGRILDLEFDPNNSNTLFAAAAGGGIWRSANGGATWTSVGDELPSSAVGAVAVLPWDSSVVLIGTGEPTWNIDRIDGVGLLKSTDGGYTWAATSLTQAVVGGRGFHIIEANPNGGTAILAGATNGLWRSTDDGDNWDLVKDGDDYYDVKWKPGDSDRVYTVKGSGGSGNNVKVSTDEGLTWAKAGTGQPSSWLVGKTRLSVTPDAPGTIYAGFADKTSNGLLGIYRSTDDGATWQLRASSPNIYGTQGWYNNTIQADPNDAEHIIVGGVALYRSVNGGTSFSQIGNQVHVDHHAIAYRPGSDNNVFVGSDGGVWESTTDGASWSDRNTGLVTYQFYDICVSQSDPSRAAGGTQDNGTDIWNGTVNWSNGLGGDGMVCNIKPTAPNVIYGELYFGDHRKTQNGGSSWSTINNGISGDGPWVTPVDMDQNTANHLYTSSADGIFRTTAGGNPWTKVGDQTAVWISISPVDGNVVWTVGGGAPWVTTDDGGTWTQTSDWGFSTGGATKILSHPTDANGAFVAFSGYGGGMAHVARTTDMGVSWQNVTGDFPDVPANAIAVDPQNPDIWFIGTDLGVWETSNAGVNWIPCHSGLVSAKIVDLEIEDAARKLVAGTHGRGMWEVDITSPSVTDVSVTSPQGVGGLLLDSPRPNPATSEARLRYAAWHDGSVTLEIVDVAGRRQARIAEHASGDGIVRTASWLTDDAPSGVYFAVLKAGAKQTTRKIVLAR